MKIIATLHQWTTPGYKPHPRVPEGDSKFSRLKFTSISLWSASICGRGCNMCASYLLGKKFHRYITLLIVIRMYSTRKKKVSYNTFQHLQWQRLPKPTLDSKIFPHILRYQYLYPGLRWESKQPEGGHTTAGPNEKAHHIQTTMENIVLLPSN